MFEKYSIIKFDHHRLSKLNIQLDYAAFFSNIFLHKETDHSNTKIFYVQKKPPK